MGAPPRTTPNGELSSSMPERLPAIKFGCPEPIHSSPTSQPGYGGVAQKAKVGG